MMPPHTTPERMLARMTSRVPKCGAVKKRAKYGSQLCQRNAARIPDHALGAALNSPVYAPRCLGHLSDEQKRRYGLPVKPAGES